MKKILAHSERDAQNRRASFEERFRYYSGHLTSLEQIKSKVNAELEVKYLKGYFGKAPNPIYGFINGKFSFSEQGLRKALKKNGADLTLFKINVSSETARELLNLNTSESWYPIKQFFVLYSKRKDVFTQTCQLTYKNIQMEITRWFIKDSPYGLYEIIPTKEMPCNPEQFILREDEFYMLDLPTLLMDLALEYQLREEEILYHAKQMRILTMETTVLDEECITLSTINTNTIERIIKESESQGLDKDQTFKAIVQPWMESIRNYLLQLTNKYKDQMFICNIGLKPEKVGGAVEIYDPRSSHHMVTFSPQQKYLDICKEKQVEGLFSIPKPTLLESPSGYQTTAVFKVADAEMEIDERIYSDSKHDLLVIYPNAKDHRFQLEIKGSIGIHALVGYLKLMPELCRQMKKFADSLNF